MPYEPQVKTTSGGASGGEEMGRCKQCGAPVTMMNVNKGPTGTFCSEECRKKHEMFVEKADALERRERVSGGLASVWIRKIASFAIVAFVFVMVAGFLSMRFNMPIPVVTNLYLRLQSVISGMLGG